MKHFKEKIYEKLILVMALTSLVVLVGITLVLFKEGMPIFKHVGLLDFIFGRSWYPTYSPAEFGIFPLILASVMVTFGALLVSVPLGVGSRACIYMRSRATGSGLF